MRISNDVTDLLGLGMEALTDQNGEIIAVFFDGSMSQPTASAASLDEPTLAFN